jgi:uncharacterized membrane protein
VIYIFLALIAYSAVIMFGSFASRLVDSALAAAIENVISAILPVLIVIPILTGKTVQNQKLGVFAAIAAGIGIAFFTIFLNKAYAANKVAIVAPIVFGGSIFITAILSYFFFKEKITLFQGIGLALLGIGLIFVTYARFTGR